jgi:hypothetical protein
VSVFCRIYRKAADSAALKTKAEESTRLTYTGLLGELEHLKIMTKLIDEILTSVIKVQT